MKNRTWIKFYCDRWLKEMSIFSIEVRGVWSGLLAMGGSNHYGPAGMIQVTDDLGLSDAQISRVISVKKSLFFRAKVQLFDAKMIELGPDNQIKIVNFYKYQSEYLRTKQYRDDENMEHTLDTNLTTIDSESTTAIQKNATPQKQKGVVANAVARLSLKDNKNIRKENIEKKKYGTEGAVLLTDSQYQGLMDKFGETEAKVKIQAFEDALLSKGYKYASHYHTILNWSRRDEADAATRTAKDASRPKFKEI
jgi:hypothetical protein